MKRLFTLLIAGLSSATIMMAQVPVNVVGEMKIANGATMVSKGEMRVGIAAASTNGHITNEGTLNLPKGITFVSDEVTDGTLLNNGTVSFTGASQSDVKVIKEFTVDTYSYVSFPFDVKVGNIMGEGENLVFNTNFYVGYYDSQRRADEGKKGGSDAGANWKFIHPDDGYEGTPGDYILKAGVGYFVYPESENFSGNKMKLVFSAYSGIDDIYPNDGVHSKKVNITYYKSAKHNTTLHFGWNIVGNTHTTNFRLDAGAGHLGEYEGYDGIFYYHKNNDWLAINPYFDKATMSPYAAAFVQTDQDYFIEYSGIGRHLSHLEGNTLFRSTLGEKYPNHLELILNSETEVLTDSKLRIISGDEYVKEFKIGEDALCLISDISSIPAFYSIVDGERMVFNSLPFSETDIPLGINIKKRGDYTINMSKLSGYENKHILLLDKELNVIQDLTKNNSYSFSSNTQVANDRFELRISDDYTNIENSVSADIYVYTENNKVYIQNISKGDHVQIYNVSGTLLVDEKVYAENVNYPLTEKGFYIVKIDGVTSFVKKVIIK